MTSAPDENFVYEFKTGRLFDIVQMIAQDKI